MASAAGPAGAATFNTGPETVVRHLQDVRLQNGSGEPLYLGYKVTYHWFGLPYAVSRGGFVFGVKDKPTQYDVEEAQVAEWQAQGHVPSPLPVYNLSAADYVLGYLMWIVAGLMVLWYGGKALLFHRPAKSAPPAVDEAAKAAAAAMAERAAQVSRPAPPKPAAVPAAAPAVETQSKPQPRHQAEPQPQIQTLRQPSPRPSSHQASQPSQTTATAMRMPVARTHCRVKALKVA
jgi:hypothetical protein